MERFNDFWSVTQNGGDCLGFTVSIGQHNCGKREKGVKLKKAFLYSVVADQMLIPWTDLIGLKLTFKTEVQQQFSEKKKRKIRSPVSMENLTDNQENIQQLRKSVIDDNLCDHFFLQNLFLVPSNFVSKCFSRTIFSKKES